MAVQSIISLFVQPACADKNAVDRRVLLRFLWKKNQALVEEKQRPCVGVVEARVEDGSGRCVREGKGREGEQEKADSRNGNTKEQEYIYTYIH